MCPHNQCFEQKIRKNITIFHLKIIIFIAVKYCSILHGHVCVLTVCYSLCQTNKNTVFLFSILAKTCQADAFCGHFFRIWDFFSLFLLYVTWCMMWSLNS